MGNSSSSEQQDVSSEQQDASSEQQEVSSEHQEVRRTLPDLGNDLLAWKKHAECIKIVEKIQETSPAARKLTDSQIGALLICTQGGDEACGDAVYDRPKFARIYLTIAQAESSCRNLPEENYATAVGIYQQTKTFGQRDIKGYWKENLSKETRLDIKESTGRIFRIMNKEQRDWRDKDIGDVCYGIQVCEKENKGIYFDKDRLEVSESFAEALYKDPPCQQSTMLVPSPATTFDPSQSSMNFNVF